MGKYIACETSSCVIVFPHTVNVALQSFGHECTGWRLFQIHAVKITLDIDVILHEPIYLAMIEKYVFVVVSMDSLRMSVSSFNIAVIVFI